MSNKLMARNRVSEEQLLAVVPPEPTATWHPLSHGAVITALEKACDGLGMKIGNRQYGATKNMMRMFGVWDLINGDTEGNAAMGLRHGLDKSLSIGICAGRHVDVCDNLLFASDVTIFRKHTGALSEQELAYIAVEAVKIIADKFNEFKEWHDSLKAIKLTDEQASLLITSAMRKRIVGNDYGLFPSQYFQNFDELYFDKNSKYSRTMHGFHGAITEIYTQKRTLVYLQEFNTRLNNYIQYEAPILLKPNKAGIFDFPAVISEAKIIQNKEVADIKDEIRQESSYVRESAQKKIAEGKKAEKATKTKTPEKPGEQPKPKVNGKPQAKAPATVKTDQVAKKRVSNTRKCIECRVTLAPKAKICGACGAKQS